MNTTDEKSYSFLLKCKREDISCQFVVSSNFGNDVVLSGKYHFHSIYEIHIPVKRNMHILSEDNDVFVKPGEVCIIPPNKIHHIFYDSEASKSGFRFSFSATDNLFTETYGAIDGVTVIETCNIYNKYILPAIENFKEGKPDFMIADMLFHLLYDIALKLKGSSYEKNVEAFYSDVLVAETIEKFLNLNYNKKIKLDDLANLLNLSKRQTERVTAKLFGVTFSPLLSKKRLSTAKFLLKTTDISIDEVSAICGFEDKNYFYKKFSAAFNTTPGKFRKENKKI